MARLAEKFPECVLTPFAGEDWYRFAHKNANKLCAVTATAEALAIPMEQVAAFGDDYIDLEMLRGCGFGVAMGNAIPEVRAAAKFVCDTNDNDGVAKWLQDNAPL